MNIHHQLATAPLSWICSDALDQAGVPATLYPWLIEPSSMTARLKSVSQVFKVNVIAQTWQTPREDECAPLHLSHTDTAFIRQVDLLCDDVIWLHARVVIPKQTLSGKEAALSQLNDTPIGEVLFANESCERSTFEFTQLDNLWVRRSVFSVQNKPLFITEVFSSCMLAQL